MPAASAGSVHGQPDPPRPPPPAAPRIRWDDLRKRAISAALLAPMAVACLWFGGWWWTALLAAASVGLAMEWVHLCGARLASPVGAAIPLMVLLAGALACLDHDLMGLGVLGAGFLLTWLLSGRASLAAGMPYLGGAIVALAWLRDDGAIGRDNVLFLLLVVWASDIGAYTAGRLLGGPKLAPRISPSKTWSGAAGGLAGAMVVGAAAALALHGGNVAHILPVAAGIGIAAQIGDLLESAVKRHYGVKDSGRLIPGHGGLLDRLDGLLTAALAAALLAATLGRGVEVWR